MKHTIPAIIFTGGRSSRMGRDKALLPFGSYDTLAAYQYHRLKHIFDEVCISTKTENLFPFADAVIIDRYPDYSPMAGLVSVLESIDAPACFVLSVDAPFVGEHIISSIIAAPCPEDAVVARNNGYIQPLCGLYKKSILPLAKETLLKNHHKMGRLLQDANSCFVDFEDDKAFMNLNHPEEYDKALLFLES